MELHWHNWFPRRVSLGAPSRLAGVAVLFFFCWRLLGLIPGGAPFSQLSSGVKDAMVIFTRWLKVIL